MDETITAHELLSATERKSGSFHFDRVSYDRTADVLVLQRGPMSAAVTERSPEGHTLRIDALENRIISIQIDGARQRVREAGSEELPVTIAPGQRLMLDPRELSVLMSSGRFSSAETAKADVVTLDKASAAKPDPRP